MKKWIYIAGTSAVVLVAVIVMFFLITKKEYEVTFDTNGGTQIATQTITKGKKVKIPVDPEKDGWNFKEWLLNGKTYNFNDELTNDITLIAKWESETKEIETYIVKFDTDGGNEIEELKIEEGNPINRPEDPIKEKYIFEYWMLDDEEFDFNIKVIENITLIAKWKETPKYTVVFNSNGGTVIAKQIVSENTTITKPKNPIKGGYTFVNWTSNGKEYNFNTKVTNDISLIANWKEVPKYTATFNSNGGTSVAKQTILRNATVTKPKDPVKDGYTFVNWTLNGKEYNFANKVINNISLVANWKAIIPKPGIPKLSIIGMGGSPMAGSYLFEVEGVSGAEGYEIYISTNSGQFMLFKRIVPSVIGGNVEQSDDVYWGETKSYKARAFKKDGNNYIYGDFSTVESKSMEALPTPMLQVVGFGSSPEGTAVLLGMTTNNPDVENFEVYKSTSRDSGYVKIGNVYGAASDAEKEVSIPDEGKIFFKVRGYITDGIKTIYTGYSNILEY